MVRRVPLNQTEGFFDVPANERLSDEICWHAWFNSDSNHYFVMEVFVGNKSGDLLPASRWIAPCDKQT